MQWLLAAWAFAFGLGLGWIIHEAHEGHEGSLFFLKIKSKFICVLRGLRG